MADSRTDEFDPTTPDRREIGRDMIDDGGGLGSVMAHAYRGEIDRVGTWRQRLDQTTTWAVTVLAAILTVAFSSAENPHYILLVGIVVLTIFLGIEARLPGLRPLSVARSTPPGEPVRERPRPVRRRREQRLAGRTEQGLPGTDAQSFDRRSAREPAEARLSRVARRVTGRVGVQDLGVHVAPRLADYRRDRPSPRHRCGRGRRPVLRCTAGCSLLAPGTPRERRISRGGPGRVERV